MGLQDFTVYDLISRNARIFAHREALVSDTIRLNFTYLLNSTTSVTFLTD